MKTKSEKMYNIRFVQKLLSKERKIRSDCHLKNILGEWMGGGKNRVVFNKATEKICLCQKTAGNMDLCLSAILGNLAP